MIYVIAAYSITIGALALYGVLLQHRIRVIAHDPNLKSNSATDSPQSGFNVGAALLAPLWMIQHGMRLPGAILLVIWAALIPLYDLGTSLPFLFAGMVPLAAGAAVGFVGNRIAAQHRGDESPADFAASQLPWATSGVLIAFVVMPWIWYAIQPS